MSETITSSLVGNLELLLAQLKAGVVIHRPDTTIRYANPSALDMLGLTQEEIQGKIADEKDWHFLDETGKRASPSQYPVNLVLATGKPVENLVMGIFDTQRKLPTWVKVSGFPEYDANHQLQRVVISFTDISHQRNNISYEQIMSYASDIVLVTDAELNGAGPTIVSVNKAFTDLLGYNETQVKGQCLSYLKIDKKSLRTLLEIKTHMQHGESFRGRIYLYSASNKPLWLDINVFPLHNWQGRISHYVAIGRDITATVNHEQSLLQDALKDPLTGLYNRRGLELQTRRFNKRSVDNSYSIIALDIDHFKRVNDAWGHKVGDIVLGEVASIMRDTVRDIDCVARIGGEEFVILLPTMREDTALQIAERIRTRIEIHRIMITPRDTVGPGDTISPGDTIGITASIGVSANVASNNPLHDTLHRADDALYQAKRSGRNRVVTAGALTTGRRKPQGI